MVAVRNYITDDRTVLSFHKGDIIRLQKMEGLEEGKAAYDPVFHTSYGKHSFAMFERSMQHINASKVLGLLHKWDVETLPSCHLVNWLAVMLCGYECLFETYWFTSNPCGCSVGHCYGCIVKKKVMLLEEIKRDTSDFGGSVYNVCMECCSASSFPLCHLSASYFVDNSIIT